MCRIFLLVASLTTFALFSSAYIHDDVTYLGSDTFPRRLRGGGWEKNGTKWAWKDAAGSELPATHKTAQRKKRSADGIQQIESNNMLKAAKVRPTGLVGHPHFPGPKQVVAAPPPAPGKSAWIPQLDDLDLPELPPNPPPQAPLLKEKLVRKLSDLRDVEATSVDTVARPQAGISEEEASEPRSVEALDKDIVEILRSLSSDGEVDKETWAELLRGGVKRKHLREAGLVASDALLMALTTKESKAVTVKQRDSRAPVDVLGRLPAWSGDEGGTSLVLRDPNPLSMVPSGPNGSMAIFNPMYGRADVSYAVAVPPAALKAAENRSMCVMTAGGSVYRDRQLEEWPQNDFRLFVGDLGQHATDKQLTEALRRWRGFNMARVAADRRSGLCRAEEAGYGFASFASEAEGVALIRHQRSRAGDPVCVGGRPITIKKGKWRRKVLRPEMMPEVMRLREERLMALSRGEISPEQAPLRNKAYRKALLSSTTQQVWTDDTK